jgi:hypothetical protein
MSTRPMTKLRDSRWESREEEEQTREKAMVKEVEEEANAKKGKRHCKVAPYYVQLTSDKALG